ncbi:hypothetical protein QQ056_14100 [Oscillatoria laete-virens NRMC-F 0139]|nr:hypothetical protein [Oscillatoria laete-virens]MDL5054670.1 hypothetical protein [Oscillatoria laete-virens NRMC-F 0139]
MKPSIVAALVLTFTITALQAGSRMHSSKGLERLNTPILAERITDDRFRAQEFSVDAFGIGVFPEKGLFNGNPGGGAGLNYFFNRYVGVGVDGFVWEGIKNEVVGGTSGSLILRYPIADRFAPYVFGGGGGNFYDGKAQATYHGGLGAEYRFTRNVGAFAEGRYTGAAVENNYGMVKSGLRFAF